MSHDIFITAGLDKYTGEIELVVQCSCGAILCEEKDDRQPQLGLDEIVDAAFYHRESHA